MGVHATRRELLYTASGAFALAGATPTAAGQPSGVWPTFGYDAANTGHAVDQRGPTRPLRGAWRFNATRDIESPPTVVDGTLYVGDYNGNLFAVDTEDGSEQWEFDAAARSGIVSAPAVVDGTVYAGSLGSNVYAVDTDDGTEEWRFETGDGIRGSPTVVDGTVYVGSGDGNVYALDTADGTERWRFETGDWIQSTPAVVDGTVYVGSGDGNVYALDAADGAERWRFETGDAVVSSPAVAEGTVYVGGTDGNVYALDTTDGTERWRFETGDAVGTSPAVADGTVCVTGGTGTVYGLAASDGTEQWRFADGDELRITDSPAVADGIVYVGGVDRYALHAIDLDDGSERWRFGTPTSAPVVTAPTVVNGTVYVGVGREDVLAITSNDSAGGNDSEGANGLVPGLPDAPLETAAVALPVMAALTYLALSSMASGDDTGGGTARSGAATTSGGDTDRSAWGDTADGPTGAATGAGDRDSPWDAAESPGDPDPGPDTDSRGATDPSSPDRPAAGTGTGTAVDRSRATTVDGDVDPSSAGPGSAGSEPESKPESTDTGPITDGPSTEAGSPADGGSSVGDGPSTGHAESADGERKWLDRSGADSIPSPEVAASPPRRELSAEDLTVRETIGTGGQAVISRAKLPADDRPPATVALREPATTGGETVDRSTVERFLSRAETWTTVDEHEREKRRWDGYEHVVGVVDAGDRQPWIALEYMDGGDLGELLADHPDGLPAAQALWIGECICRGLEIAHALGRAHLDVKPENVLLKRTDGWPWPKLADWGLTRTLAEETGAVEGLSVTYAAPEQFDADAFGDPDQLTDIYQTGALVYALLTGRPPATGSRLEVMQRVTDEVPIAPPSEHRPGLPPAIDAAVELAVERIKTDRYDSISAFRKAMEAIRTGEPLPRPVVDRLDG